MSATVPARLRRLRARRGAMQLALAIGTCERAASPVLLTVCALLPRCRQPQLRAVGLDGHRALDSFATTGRRDVDTTVTRIRPPARPRAGPGGAKPVPVKPVKPVSRARASSRLSGAVDALLDSLTIESGPVEASTPSWSSAPRPQQQAPPRPRRGMILLMHCLFVRMAGAAFTPKQDQPPPSVWPGSQRRRRSRSGCSGRLGGTGVPSEAPASPFHTCRWGAWQCEPWRCLSGAASRNGSTTSPPPARRQPTLTRVALT